MDAGAFALSMVSFGFSVNGMISSGRKLARDLGIQKFVADETGSFNLGAMLGSKGSGNTVYTEAQQAVRDGNTATIGKMSDLNAPNSVGSGEFKVADYLPDMGNPQANWNQNSGVLRSVMNENMPIKDVSPFPMDNAGFLGAERNLLQNAGWYYSDGYWYPPVQ